MLIRTPSSQCYVSNLTSIEIWHLHFYAMLIMCSGCIIAESAMPRDALEVHIPESCRCNSAIIEVVHGESFEMERPHWKVIFAPTRGGATYLFGTFLINDQRPQHWNGILYGCDTPRCFISYANLVGPELDTTRNHITLPCPDPACATAPD